MTTPALSRDEILSNIQDMIKDIRIAMLATTAEDGSVFSRPMATQETRFQGELWFLTRQDSGKVAEIRHDAHVNVSYVDVKNSSFVSLSGKAQLSKDPQKIHELWNPLYKAWFPNGEEDPEITVLKVVVADAEYWSAPSSSIVRNYRMLKASITKDGSQVGEHQHVSLIGSRSGS
jgi:general stress protein 26